MLRRNLFAASLGLLAAPALVRIDSIMPVRLWRPEAPHPLQWMIELWAVDPRNVFRTTAGLHLTREGHKALVRAVVKDPQAWARRDYALPIG